MTAAQMTVDELAQHFDHTLLKADATLAGFERLCQEARDHGFAMVAVNPSPVHLCKELLVGSNVQVGAAIGFPLGQNTISQKVAETVSAIDDGADEIDYVINVGELKDGHPEYIQREMAEIVAVCKDRGILSKVILETCYLTDDEKRTVAEIAREIRPDFVKTSTGFGVAGATAADVKLLKQAVGDAVQVKASGGVRSLEDALLFIELGATRLGSSSSVAIVEEYRRGR